MGLDGVGGFEGIGRVTTDVMIYASSSIPETMATKATVTPILILVDDDSGGLPVWSELVLLGIVITSYSSSEYSPHDPALKELLCFAMRHSRFKNVH